MEWLDSFGRWLSVGETDVSVAQMCVRALIIFSYGIAAARLGAWRAFGRWSSPDIIVAIIIGSNLSRALTGPAPLVPTMAATTVLILAYWAVSIAASRSDRLDRLFKGVPLPLIVRGEVKPSAMHRAALSARDLDEALREKGVVASADVVAAFLERNGQITVIRGEDVE